MAMQSPAYVPTVDDLRVKLCFICREEERYGDPQEDPLRPWTHPCSCTLVAHESCLLHWIQAAQQDPARARNALKCPQCGAIYQLESDNPLILRILDHTNSILSLAGKVVMIGGLAGVVVSFGFGIYIICTSYGAYALREMLGQKMYDTLLTDDPSNWPWHAYINLPMVPFGLLLSRISGQGSFDKLPTYFFPLFLAWPSCYPAPPATRKIVASTWSLFGRSTASVPYGPVFGWPPSPLMATMLYPLISKVYREQYQKAKHFIMGTQPVVRGPVRDIIWDFGGEGPMPFRGRIGLAVDPAEARQQQQQPQGQRANPPADDPQDQEQADAPGVVADRTIRISNASLGRLIGGTLLMPTIANIMGAVLHKLAKRSPALRTFLAIRPPSAGLPRVPLVGGWLESQGLNEWGYAKKIGVSMHVALCLVCGGTRVWYESDPVWWRNSIGLGIFVLAKDAIKLLHLYLAKKEVETRRVKNRSFEGIDLRELDLIDRPAP